MKDRELESSKHGAGHLTNPRAFSRLAKALPVGEGRLSGSRNEH